MNRSTDVDIPRSAWSAWREDGKPQQLRRALTAEERAALQVRHDELFPALAPFSLAHEGDSVALALAAMFGSFRSMRQSGDEVMAILDGVRQAVQRFPAWAIIKCCKSIQENGVWRDGKFDRQWAPSDAEIVDLVRREIAHYERTFQTTIDLLHATVEDR